MISRRILRIKVLQSVYSFFERNDTDISVAEHELQHSVERSYDLYYHIMLLVVEIVNYAQSQINLAKQKKLPTQAEINPNRKFVDNKFVAMLRENEDFKSYVSSRNLSWEKNLEVPKSIYSDLIETNEYKKYMESDKTSFSEDKKLINFILENLVAEDIKFFRALEEQSFYWIDTAEFFIGMVLRTFDRMKESNILTYKMLPMYKNSDDKDFAIRLLDVTIAKNEENRKLIAQHTQNWELERIALLDIILLETAVTEICEFPEIPLRVTFNEYIELAKNYSTENSPTFINGVLDKIVQTLINEKKINKIAEIPNISDQPQN